VKKYRFAIELKKGTRYHKIILFRLFGGYLYYTNLGEGIVMKSKVTAGVLAIILGGLGIHKFYLGKIGMGILYIAFCWTGIPEVVGLIEGILYLTATDEDFQTKYVNK